MPIKPNNQKANININKFEIIIILTNKSKCIHI